MSLLVLEDDKIRSLMQNTLLLEAFPFLKNAAQQIANSKPKCGKCGRAAENVHIRSVKVAIAGMSKEAQQKFKDVTGASQIKVVYRAGNGKVVTIEF